MCAAGLEEFLGQPLGLRRLADEWVRKQRLVDELAVAADGGLGGEPLVGRDVLDEAEQLGRERWLRQRRGPDSADPCRHLDRVVELAPVVFAEAERDPVAAEIVDRLAKEVVTMIRVTLARLELRGEPVEVALGGGLMQSRDERLIGAIEAGVKDTAPAATVRVTSSPPIVGAALLGLDELGAGEEAQQRLRRELAEVFPGVENLHGDGRKRPGRSRR